MITTKGRYALRIMIDLAQHDTDAYIPLKDIAARQGISKKYLEVIVKDLVKGGLVSAASGKGGGYKLNRTPAQYSVGDILTATEGSMTYLNTNGRGGYYFKKTGTYDLTIDLKDFTVSVEKLPE